MVAMGSPYFLAIHCAGTLSGAARSLKVEHSTVSRRLAALGSRDAWLVVHPDLARVPRVRVVMEFVVAVMTEEAASFRGHTGHTDR
jgi:hypothetical protein